MPTQLTAEDVTQSLAAHVAAKGAEIYQKYGPKIGWKELLRILEDRSCIRYPCEIRFDSGPLLASECAHPVPKGERPEDGFCVYVRPLFLSQLHHVPHLVLYQLVLVNYGEFASSDDAEAFGAAALGISKDESASPTLHPLETSQIRCSTVSKNFGRNIASQGPAPRGSSFRIDVTPSSSSNA